MSEKEVFFDILHRRQDVYKDNHFWLSVSNKYIAKKEDKIFEERRKALGLN